MAGQNPAIIFITKLLVMKKKVFKKFTVVERQHCTLTRIRRYEVKARTGEEAVHMVMSGGLDAFEETEDEDDSDDFEYEVETDDEE